MNLEIRMKSLKNFKFQAFFFRIWKFTERVILNFIPSSKISNSTARMIPSF